MDRQIDLGSLTFVPRQRKDYRPIRRTKRQRLSTLALRLVIERRPPDRQQPALPAQAQPRMVAAPRCTLQDPGGGSSRAGCGSRVGCTAVKIESKLPSPPSTSTNAALACPAASRGVPSPAGAAGEPAGPGPVRTDDGAIRMGHRDGGAREPAGTADRDRREADLVAGGRVLDRRLAAAPAEDRIEVLALKRDVADAADAAGEGAGGEIRLQRHGRRELLRQRLHAGPAVAVDAAGAAGIVRHPRDRELGWGAAAAEPPRATRRKRRPPPGSEAAGLGLRNARAYAADRRKRRGMRFSPAHRYGTRDPGAS